MATTANNGNYDDVKVDGLSTSASMTIKDIKTLELIVQKFVKK